MVSVVIPFYNSENFIMDAVKSVIAQDVETEIIIVDDASASESVKKMITLLSSLFQNKSCENTSRKLIWSGVYKAHSGERKDIHLRLYQNEKRSGTATTRNVGVKCAKGEYVAFLDADDYWAKNKLKKQLKVMSEADVCMCTTGRALVTHDGSKVKGYIGTIHKITLRDLEKTNLINCSSVLIKKEVALNFPMKHSDAHEDYLTWIKILKEYDYIAGIDEPLLFYRLRAKSKSKNKIKSVVMTYKTYCYAGYGSFRRLTMMLSYMVNGIKKHGMAEQKMSEIYGNNR